MSMLYAVGVEKIQDCYTSYTPKSKPPNLAPRWICDIPKKMTRDLISI